MMKKTRGAVVSAAAASGFAGFVGLAWMAIGEPNEAGKLNNFVDLTSGGPRVISASEVDHNFQVLAEQVLALQDQQDLARVRYGNNHGVFVDSATGTSKETQLPMGSLAPFEKVSPDSLVRLEFSGTLGLRRQDLTTNGPCTCNLYAQLYQGSTPTGCVARTQLSWEDKEVSNGYIDIKTPVALFTDCASLPAQTYQARVTLEVKPADADECRCYIGAGPSNEYYTFTLAVDEYM